MLDVPFAAAFTAGMLATVNPCGFAMLPAYLGFFLGTEQGRDRSTTGNLLRALVVGSVVSLGFLVVFGAIGVAIDVFAVNSIGDWTPWLTVVIGIVLVVAGIAFITGWEPKVPLPRLDKGGRTRGLASMFVFGVSYAIASVSCTIGPFTTVVIASFGRESFAAGAATFVAYGLGMALLLIALTITLSLAEQGLVTGLRSLLPYVTRISGVIMVVMGAYLAWYGVYEVRRVLQGDEDATQGPVGTVTGWSSDISSWIDGLDPVQVALVLALVISSAVLVVLLRSPKDPHTPADPTDAA